MDVDTDQRLHDLEQRHVSLKKEYDLVLIDKEALKGKVASLQSFLDQNAQQISQADRRVSDHALELAQKEKLVQDLTAANEELNDKCRRRSDECDRLRDDLKAQAAELVSLQTRLKESQMSFNEYQTSTLPTQYELTKTLHEKDRFAEQVKYLEEELQKKTREERAFRAESGGIISQLEINLAQANAQNEDAVKQLAALKDLSSNQQEKIDFYMNKLKEAESTIIEKQGAFTAEVEGLKRLVDLYKRYFEEATAKVSDLEQHEAVIRETNANVLKTLRDKISLQVSESEAAAEKERAEWAHKVAQLEEQLRDAQQQQQQLQSSHSVVPFIEGGPISGSSSGGGGASNGGSGSVLDVTNFDGVGLTEMYDRIVQTEKELFAERSKRREVELYMQQILKDVEAKAPIIAAQRRDYHRVVESHSALTRRLDSLVVENADLKSRVKALQQTTDTAVQDAQALEEHNADLGRQVQHLLQRSMGVQFGSAGAARVEAEADEDQQLNTPGGVISQYMVTFNDVAELQKRNAELLLVVRKLSREQVQSQQQLQITAGGGDGEEGAMEIAGPFSSPGASLTHASSSSAGRSGGSGASNTSNNSALQAALEELNNMREARKRTEEMVVVLAQQRDMYRAMAEGDSTVFPLASPSSKSPSTGALFGAQTPAAGQFSSGMPTTPGQSSSSSSSTVFGTAQLRELQSKLAQAEEERRRLQERMARFEEAEQLLNESLDRVRKEATAARLEAAQGTSEARFQRERAERLESTLQSTQQESASALQRRLELERTLLAANKEVRDREDRIAQLHDELRAAQDAQRRAEIDAEVAKAAESRLIGQISEAREETRRHVALVEHINRIESGLQGRSEAERETLVAENEALKASFDTLRKQLDDRTLLDEQRAKVAEEEIRSIRTRLEQKTAELAAISEQLAREQITAHAAQERGNLLERQLSIAQERLTHTQGAQIIETSMANEYTAKELALERAQAEIEALKQQVTSTESHAEQFRKISAANETALKELRAKVAAAQAEQESEVARMRAELEAAQKDVQDSRVNSQGLLQEAEDAREHLRAFAAESSDKVRKLEEALSLQQQECEQLRSQGAAVSGEIAKYQEAAGVAHQNYERELQMHATAERELSEMRRLLQETKASLLQEQQRGAQLASDCIRKETQLSDERARYQSESREMREQLAGLQATNDLLHTQVQSYGLQIERLHEQRLLHAGVSSSAAASSSSFTTAGAGTSPASTAGAGTTATSSQQATQAVQPSQQGDTTTAAATEGGDAMAAETQQMQVETTDAATTTAAAAGTSTTAAAADTEAPYDEVTELRKSTSEMREVLRYMKREKDMLQAKLSVAETENTRLVSELQTIRRALDEVKVELKRELDKRTPLRSADDFNRLMAEVNQLNIVRESNLHLRAENEELSKRATALTNALTEAKDAAAPLEDTIRKLRAEKESLEMVNDQLTNDVAYWRTRLQTLISRYNDVDPEEHRLLKSKLEEVTASLAEVQQALADQRKSAEEAAAASTDTNDKEIANLKAQVAGAETTANKLRDALRMFKERYEAALNRVKDADAKLGAEKASKATLETQIAEANAQIETLNASIAAVTAAKAQVEAQLAKAGPAAAGTAAADSTTGAAAAIPANRRKRPLPGTQGATAPAAEAPATATGTGAVPTTTAVQTPAVAAPAASAPAPAVTAAAATTATPAAAITAEEKKAQMKENLMRKKAAAAAAAAAAASAAEANSSTTEAPAAASAAVSTPAATGSVTGKRGAPADSEAAQQGATGAAGAISTTTAAGAGAAGNAAKRRRPAPAAAAPDTTATPATAEVVQEVATPAATTSAPAADAPAVTEPAPTEETVEMSSDANEGVVDLVSESDAATDAAPASESAAPVTAATVTTTSTAAVAEATPAAAQTPAEAAAPSKAAPKIGTGNPFAIGFGATAGSAFKPATASMAAGGTPSSGEGKTGTDTSPPARSIFGSSQSSLTGPFSAPTSSGLFGAATSTTTATAATAANPWGAAKGGLNAAASSFAPSAGTGFGMFGSSATTPAGAAKNLFGAPAAASASGGGGASSLFGAAKPAGAGTSAFGAVVRSTSSAALNTTAAAAPVGTGAAPAVDAAPTAAATSTTTTGAAEPTVVTIAASSLAEQQKREARAARFAMETAAAAEKLAPMTAAAAAPSKAAPVVAEPAAPATAPAVQTSTVEVDEAEVDAFLQSALEEEGEDQNQEQDQDQDFDAADGNDQDQQEQEEYGEDKGAATAAGGGQEEGQEEGEEMEEGEV